jgi:phenylpyruvate tautomerase PptA (4-oxalocrotonate tautomerase family)
MPMIQVKLTTPMSEDQNVKLHENLTDAVVEIFHKPIEYVMVHVEKEADLWMAGQKLKKGAYLSASLMGEIKNEDADRFTAKVCEIFKTAFDIDGAQVYATFQTINQWGWDGKIL